MDNTLTVDHVDIFDLGTHIDQQLHAGTGSSTGTQTHDLRIRQFLAGQLQCVDHAGSGYDRCTVLVIVENRNLAALDQYAFDLEALWRLDVFKVDATEGFGNARNSIDERLRAFCIDFDIDGVNTGKTLEQQRLAFHDRLGGQRSQITQPQNGGTVGNNSNQVAFGGVTVSRIRVLRDFTHRLGHTRRVGQRKVAGSLSGGGKLYTDLTRTRELVVIEGGLFKILRHGCCFQLRL